jgi:hypothetical protein
MVGYMLVSNFFILNLEIRLWTLNPMLLFLDPEQKLVLFIVISFTKCMLNNKKTIDFLIKRKIKKKDFEPTHTHTKQNECTTIQ